MQITEVKIHPIKPQNGLVALASITLEDKLVLHSIGVYTKKNDVGYRITYPTKRARDKDSYVYNPIDEELGSTIALAVLRKAEMVLSLKEVNDDRYDNSKDTQRGI